MKHLFIGSEGTLGLVTKVALHCPVLPKSVNLGFFGKAFIFELFRPIVVKLTNYNLNLPGVKSFENVLKLYKSAKSKLGEILSAFEMADFDSINVTSKNLKLP